jgi:hypothetical protein
MTKNAKAFSAQMGWDGKEADKLMADLLERKKIAGKPAGKTKK